MQFSLPENLKNSIVAYDSVLKEREANKKREQRALAVYAKPKNALGLPVDMLPESVVDRKEFLIDLETINSVPIENRILVRKNYVIYHYESVWHAFWFPLKKEDSDTYLYGYSTAFKNTTKLRADKTNLLDVSSQIIKYNRSEFVVTIKYETIAKVLENKDKRSYIENHFIGGHKKSRFIAKGWSNFIGQLVSHINVWEDYSTYTILDRIRDTSSYLHLLIDSREYITDNSKIDFATWQPTFEGIIDYLEVKDHEENFAVIGILNRPFFKKKFGNLKEEIDEILHSTNKTIKKKDAIKPGERVMRLIRNIKFIESVWPNCPIDYYQTHFEILEKIRYFSWSNRPRTNAWLNSNMPVATFFNFLGKYKKQVSVFGDHEILEFQLWYDSYSMLNSILNKEDSQLAQPKRWRLQEFHDYLQEESWKLTTKNEVLPQDLFPTPITVFGQQEWTSQEKWTFFQPIDVHQLASWGQAVRNCVGAASSYSEGVKKKQHFIVLAMINNTPTFTVQLKVENGQMSVTQIVSICNRRLTDEEKEQYVLMFGAALEKRNLEIVK